MVAVLAHALALIRRDVFGVACEPERAATAALYHDCSEILTGDLPTPIKYHSPEIRDAYRKVEELACEKLLANLPACLRESYAPCLSGELAGAERELVKAADKLAAYLKCVEERKAGNNDFLSAEAQTRAALEQNPLPELRYFLEHFAPAFELTIDELGTIDTEGRHGTEQA